MKPILDHICKSLMLIAPEKIVLFGSRARGDATDRSDFDIAVWGNVSRDDWVKTKLELIETVPTLCALDLVLVDENISPELLSSIQREGKLLYEKQ